MRGVGDATDVGLGLGTTSAVAFLRVGLGVGEAAASDSAAEGDAALWTGGVASVRFCVRCFGGEGDSTGVPVSSCDWTCVIEIVRLIPNTRRKIFRAMVVLVLPRGRESLTKDLRFRPIFRRVHLTNPQLLCDPETRGL